MRDEIEREEERRIGQRRRRDVALPGDVDAREAEAREDPDDDQIGELTVPRAQPAAPSVVAPPPQRIALQTT
jgi:hypothetical protein